VVIAAIVVNHKVKEKEQEVETRERQAENKTVREHILIYFYEITSFPVSRHQSILVLTLQI
jgi:hypothetical protein